MARAFASDGGDRQEGRVQAGGQGGDRPATPHTGASKALHGKRVVTNGSKAYAASRRFPNSTKLVKRYAERCCSSVEVSSIIPTEVHTARGLLLISSFLHQLISLISFLHTL